LKTFSVFRLLAVLRCETPDLYYNIEKGGSMTKHKFDKQEIREGAPFGVLSYIYFLWIFTFIFKKDNRFAEYHARQGIVIFIGHLASLILYMVPFLRWLGLLFEFLLLCLCMYGIFLVLTGKSDRIPVVGDVADKLII
jgi:uncharacterized membrane protein